VIAEGSSDAFRNSVAEGCPRQITEGCMRGVLLETEGKLHRIFVDTLDMLGSTEAGKAKVQQLKSLQDGWESHRDANCKFLTADNVEIEHNKQALYDCMAMANVQRSIELIHFLGD
jgi:uncharacterized protein YecT (DUF1311 family)